MSLSPECAVQHERESAGVKKILTFAAVGSLGIHGLAWAISAVLPKQVIATENPPIELILVSEPEEEELPELEEEILEIQEPEPEPEEFELSDSTQSRSDFLTAAAQLAPEQPSFPEPIIPEIPAPEIAAAPPLPEPTVLVEPEPEIFEPEEIVEEPEPLEPEVEPEEIVEELEIEEAEIPEEVAEEVEEIEEIDEVVETEVEGAIATEPALEEKPTPKKTSLLDKIKEIRTRNRQNRETAKTATSGNNNSDAETTSSKTTAPSPQKTATGPSQPTPSSSSGTSTPENNGQPSTNGKPGGKPVAAREPESQGTGNSNQPARQTIECRRCSKPKFSKRELKGAEGETQFEVITDARGRVVDVIVTQSSGSSAVDEKTVAHIKRRWRFAPTSGGATVPVTVDMAVEGSDYYREREAAQTQERLEYEAPAQPAPVANDPIPTAVTEPKPSSPQPVDVPIESTNADSVPEAVFPSTPSQPQSALETESKEINAPEFSAPTFETELESPSLDEPEPAYEAPEPAYEAPAPAYEAPAPAYESPAPAYEAPAPAYESPAPAYEAPAPAYEAPAPAYEAPAPYYAPEPVYEEPYYEPAPVIEEPYLEE